MQKYKVKIENTKSNSITWITIKAICVDDAIDKATKQFEKIMSTYKWNFESKYLIKTADFV